MNILLDILKSIKYASPLDTIQTNSYDDSAGYKDLEDEYIDSEPAIGDDPDKVENNTPNNCKIKVLDTDIQYTTDHFRNNV